MRFPFIPMNERQMIVSRQMCIKGLMNFQERNRQDKSSTKTTFLNICNWKRYCTVSDFELLTFGNTIKLSTVGSMFISALFRPRTTRTYIITSFINFSFKLIRYNYFALYKLYVHI